MFCRFRFKHKITITTNVPSELFEKLMPHCHNL